MRWWPWARRGAEVTVPPRSPVSVLPPAPALPESEADSSHAPGGVRLVMEDGTAVELPPDTPQARAFAAVAEVLTAGLPRPAEGSSRAPSRR